MRNEHRDDHGSRDDRSVSANILQIQRNVEKIRPIDKALESTVCQNHICGGIIGEETYFGEPGQQLNLATSITVEIDRYLEPSGSGIDYDQRVRGEIELTRHYWQPCKAPLNKKKD